MSEELNPTPTDNPPIGMVAKNTAQNKRKRVSEPLPWYARQWWSGFLSGVQVGVLVGLAVSIPLAFLTKWLFQLWWGI